MKKFITSLFILCAATNVFAEPVSVDAFKSTELRYISIGEYTSVLRDGFSQPTFVFYVSPYISSKLLKSDVVSITCNGNEVLVAPGSSYACVMRDSLSWGIASDYQRNGADMAIMVIPGNLVIDLPSDNPTIPKK